MAKRSRTLAPDPAALVPPDGSAVVSRLRSTGSDGTVVSVMVGRVSVAKIDASEVAELNLHTGTPWTCELAHRLGNAAAKLAARRHAIRLIAARPRAKADLQRRLIRAGHKAQFATAAADALESAGVIDDHAFAEAAAATLAARTGASRRAVETKLRTRGVSAKDAAKAAAEATQSIDERQAATDLACKRVARQTRPADAETTRRRLYSFLLRRGFDHEDARHAVESALASLPTELD